MDKLAWSLKAVASDRRLHIVLFLYAQEHTLQDIALELQVCNATAFFHLHKLRREGFVQCRRSGHNTYYALTPAFRRSALLRKIRKMQPSVI